jgi:hypothetical protein
MTTTSPSFVVVSVHRAPPEILAHGTITGETFRRLFLDSYEIEGERYHPGPESAIAGVLLATSGKDVSTVPIWTWFAPDGTSRFLCQASDDGSAPAFSALAYSEAELVEQIQSHLQP